MENDSNPSTGVESPPPATPRVSHTRVLDDGSMMVVWPRDPTAVDDRTDMRIGFRPIPGGPVLRVSALRYRPFDVSGPFGVTAWAYRIPPAEVRRATALARAETEPRS